MQKKITIRQQGNVKMTPKFQNRVINHLQKIKQIPCEDPEAVLKTSQELFDQLNTIVKVALNNFFIKDGDFLLGVVDVNERALSHKIAEHLDFAVQHSSFSKHNVDCEYNRIGNSDKSIAKRLLLKERCREYYPDDVKLENINGSTVYPDIIIHQRGEVGTDTNLANLLIIEIKKYNNTDKKSRDFDECKITQYCEQLNYRVGLFIDLGIDIYSTKLKWFYDGERIETLAK